MTQLHKLAKVSSSGAQEQATGLEPVMSAWEALVLPLHHACTNNCCGVIIDSGNTGVKQQI